MRYHLIDEAAFFDGFSESHRLYGELLHLLDSIGPVELHITKSQIAVRRGKPFSWIWIPEKHLRRKSAPLVLSIIFARRDPSPRWKEIVETAPGCFMHHLEIWTSANLDDEVKNWLQIAWTNAGNPR